MSCPPLADLLWLAAWTRTAAILAGGRAQRFGGRPKPLLPVGDRRIIDRQLAALRTVAGRVAVVTADRARYGALGIPLWEDLLPGCGPLGGIYTALVNAATPQTLIVAGDMPFLTSPFLRHLARAGRDVDVALARTADGPQPLCASYGKACVDPIRRNIERGALRVADLLAEVRVREIGPDEIAGYDRDGTLFFNVNTPADHARGLALAARRARRLP